ncbi:Concanavalin A-like lectin protein kinase family protein, partial [Prunus dulcis]
SLAVTGICTDETLLTSPPPPPPSPPIFFSPTSALDFLFNSFSNITNATNLTLIDDALLDATVIRLTNDTVQFSVGRVFYPTKLAMRPTSNSSSLTSFSTSFVFSVLPDIASSPGFGLCFVLSNSTSPPNALASQYFGLFTNATVPFVAPLLAVEFDTGQNPEFNDPDGNHIGIDLNNIESAITKPARYYDSSGGLVPIQMRTGQNVRAWIEFDGTNFEFNVTVAPANVSRPSLPTLTYRDPKIANYVSAEMFVGFSASKTQWIEAQRVLAWSFSDTGVAREINTTNLPVFQLSSSSSSSLSTGAIAGIAIGCVVVVLVLASGFYLYWRKNKLEREEKDEIEDWELEYWPHRFSNEELSEATDGFSKDQLLVLQRDFIKRHRNRSQMRQPRFEARTERVHGGDRKHGQAATQELGPNARMVQKEERAHARVRLHAQRKPQQVDLRQAQDGSGWEQRRRVLADVAEGLTYLHHGWDQMVVHRDIKSSNILLDAEMRGRLGDFGLAKLYQHGEVPNTTRVVGTLGYLAPELATVASPTAASDVYSFGVVLLEVACGRKPIEMEAAEDEVVLIDWVRELYARGRVGEAADRTLEGQYEEEQMEVALKLGLACCHPDPQRRPSMKEIVAVLVGESAAAAAPAALLSELARGDSNVFSGGGGGSEEETEEVAPLQPQPPSV